MFWRSKPISRSQELIFLDADDDLGTIRSKLEASGAEEIFLVIPRRSSVLRTPLEFRILARVANELSSETVLVTDDGARRRLAGQEGFRTRRSLRSLGHLMMAPGDQPARFVIPDWVPLPHLDTVLMTLAVLAVVAIAALLVLPVETVTLVPQTTEVSRTLEVVVDPSAKSVDPAAGVLPGLSENGQVSVASSLPVPADRTVGANSAHGEVALTNAQASPVDLGQGTVVMVPNGGPSFTTDSAVTLQPRQTTRVGVTAKDPGSGGNVGPGSITQVQGMSPAQVRVTNPSAMTGGTDRKGSIVSKQDQDQLQAAMLKQAQGQLVSILQSEAGPSTSLPQSWTSAKVTSVSFDQQPGTEAPQLTGKMTVSGTGIAFRNADFNRLVGEMLVLDAGKDFQLDGSPKISPPAPAEKNGGYHLTTKASAALRRALDQNQLQQALRGKSLSDAKAYLASLGGLAEPPTVHLSPSWAPRAFRIDIHIQGPSK